MGVERALMMVGGRFHELIFEGARYIDNGRQL